MTITAFAGTDPDVARPSSMDAIALRGVDRSFGAVRAVRELTLSIRRGESTALLGPNGAGKTTTIAMILGLLRPDRGEVTILGRDPEAAVAAGSVGAMLQDGGMPSGVRVAELLAMLRAQYRAPMSVARAVGLAQLDGLEARRVDRLSGGQTQKLRLAIALIGDPEVLVLDEPTAAMDVEARRHFWRDMRELSAAGRTLLYSTHHLEEADANSDRIVVLAGGRVRADATPQAIKASVGLRALAFSAAHLDGGDLRALPGVTAVQVRGARAEVRAANTDIVLRAVMRAYPDAHDIDVTGVGLEDAFLALTDPGTHGTAPGAGR